MNDSAYDISIPSIVLHDNRLQASEKILYGEFLALCSNDGCYKINSEYFANLYDVNIAIILRWTYDLEKANYIDIKYDEDNSLIIYIKLKEHLTKFKTQQNSSNNKYKDEIKEIIDYLNAKVGSRYRYNSEGNNKHIRARLNENYTVDDFKVVIDNKVADWLNSNMEQFLRPATLFGNKFDQYLNQRTYKSPQSEVTRKEWDGKFYSDEKY